LHWKWAEGEDPENDERIIEKICSIYTFSYTLATAISPVIGSLLFDSLGFVWASEISGIFIFIMSLIYLFFYSGFNIFKQTIKENEYLYKLR
jgi:MFS family permease